MSHDPERMLAHYRLVEALKSGAMGVVWKAFDTRLERPVALKMLPEAVVEDRQRLARFEREAKALAALNHPGIVTIFSVEFIDRAPMLVMEFVDGPRLADVIPDAGLALDRFLELAIALTDAVGAAHGQGITHRDLKPANVVLDRNGRPKVLDFGLAKLRQPRPVSSSDETTVATSEDGIVGTISYMAPEQLRGHRVDHRSDVFSLGVLFYEMLTGRLPFDSRVVTEVISAILTEEPTPLGDLRPALPARLTEIVGRCLAKESGSRYATAQELRQELEQLASNGTPGTRDAGEGRTVWPSSRRSIAVLPLENLSGDPTQEYIADGMTEALITDLARIGGLKVISRTSVMVYKGVKQPPSNIAHELGVDTIIEGTVLCAGERVRITAQLTDAVSDQLMWADRYDRDLRDVLAVQSEVAQAVVGQINVKLTPHEQERISESRHVDPNVYLLDLKGRHFLNHRTENGFRRGLECFQQAIDIDPTYPPAYVGLADCFNMLVNYGLVPVRQGLPRSRAALARALELDDGLGAAHRALALIHWQCEFDWAKAEETYQRALELDPSSADTRYWHGAFLAVWGRFDRSLGELRRAQELDPLSLNVSCFIGWLHYFQGRFDEAVAHYREVLQLDRYSLMANWFMGQALAELERYDESIEWLEKSMAIAGRTSRLLGYLGYVYGRAGRKPDAHRLLAELDERSRRDYVPPYFRALIHCGLGDEERAFECLTQAAELPDTMVRDLKVDPPLQILRSDPRYEQLLRRLRLD